MAADAEIAVRLWVDGPWTTLAESSAVARADPPGVHYELYRDLARGCTLHLAGRLSPFRYALDTVIQRYDSIAARGPGFGGPGYMAPAGRRRRVCLTFRRITDARLAMYRHDRGSVR